MWLSIIRVTLLAGLAGLWTACTATPIEIPSADGGVGAQPGGGRGTTDGNVAAESPHKPAADAALALDAPLPGAPDSGPAYTPEPGHGDASDGPGDGGPGDGGPGDGGPGDGSPADGDPGDGDGAVDDGSPADGAVEAGLDGAAAEAGIIEGEAGVAEGGSADAS